MNETTLETPHTIDSSASPVAPVSPAFAASGSNPDRIQVSCIDEEDDALFLSPRPFNLTKRENRLFGRKKRAKETPDFQHADDIVNYAVRSIRRVGYALILTSVLLLVVDGILRHTFGI